MLISQNKLFQVALYCNAIYIFLFFLFRPDGIHIGKLIISGFLLISVIIVLFLVVKNLRSIKVIPKGIKYVYILLFIWSSFTVIRSFSLNLQDWVTNFGNVYMALAWFVPAVLILGKKIEVWNFVFKAIFFMFFLMIASLIIYPFHDEIKTEWTWLLRPLNFVLIIGLYKKSLINKISTFLILIVYTIIAIKIEQRIEFIFLILVVLFLIIDKLKHLKFKRSILKYIFIGFLIFLYVVFTFGWENVFAIISKFTNFQDTRYFLFQELFAELSQREQIIGRGSLGTYYSEFFEGTRRYYEITKGQSWEGDAAIRITTEVGYLQMILKGGFILFFLTAFMMFYSAYLGIFRSKNKFTRRLGIFILLFSILSIVSFRPAFTPMFIILWLSIGTVIIKNNRDMSNEEIFKIMKLL